LIPFNIVIFVGSTQIEQLQSYLIKLCAYFEDEVVELLFYIYLRVLVVDPNDHIFDADFTLQIRAKMIKWIIILT